MLSDRLNDRTLPDVLASHPEIAARLGGTPGVWRASEVSDGNMNLVWRIAGPAGVVCAKQATSTVRVDDTWPVPTSRAGYEVAWLRAAASVAPERVPALYLFDPDRALIVMEYLTPHRILRGELIARRRHPDAASAVGDFIARVGFATSDLACTIQEKAAGVAAVLGNAGLLRITADLILTDPYVDSTRNRWTRPHLDAAAAAIRADVELKSEVARLGVRFLTTAQGLIHGDLHTGSVMVTPSGTPDTRIIDGEFCLYGPIGFDLGAFAANLLLSAFSQPGHPGSLEEIAAFQSWLVDQLDALFGAFQGRFLALWRAGGRGDAFPAAFFADAPDVLDALRDGYVAGIVRDAMGYTGMKMIRRLLSYAHVADFESIADPTVRALLERAALHFARDLIVDPPLLPGLLARARAALA